MDELRYRTEDFKSSELEEYFVPSGGDEEIITKLSGRETVLLVGSRGVGKSFLLRLSEHRLEKDFASRHVVPVYVTFFRSTLLQAGNQIDFRAWMLARICSQVVRALANCGVSAPKSDLTTLTGGQGVSGQTTRLDEIVEALEGAWRHPTESVATASVPTVEAVRDAVADICEASSVERINLFIDEAAHVLVPEHQRQFFTLMRDLRSPYIAVKAAVYPGTTAYGDSFEPSHDATMLSVDRDPTKGEYLDQMREIVLKQDPALARMISENRSYFDALATAASGNPRTLLKTLARAKKLTARNVTEVVREFYREEIWSDHSNLGERYAGHRRLIDWGREFLEGVVVGQLSERNQGASEKSAFFWIHRDSPAAVKEALRLLSYSGLVHESGTSIKGTRSELGTRYMVNLGCLLAVENEPVPVSASLRGDLSIKRMMEFGKNHRAYEEIARLNVDASANPSADALRERLDASVGELDLSDFQKKSLRSVGLETIGGVLQATEDQLQEAHYVGPTRSRQMMNAAQAAVLEYLSG
ncbi:MAG: hypothetical protein IT200_04210 [Thermoleophilia bacterium]|nr:hypothetical protein [Thermoleophilia bacterium]